MRTDDYYLNCELVVPEIGSRHIRIKKGKTIIGSRIKFSSAEKLKRWLHFMQPDDVYFTVAKWMNPELFHGKKRYPGWHKSRRIMIGCDFVVDIDVRPDGDNVRTWIDGFENMKKAGEVLQSLGFNDIVYVNSGRGYHVYVRDYWKSIREKVSKVHYMDRSDIIRQDMIKICRKLVLAGVKFDEQVSCDPFRVVRVWGKLSASYRKDMLFIFVGGTCKCSEIKSECFFLVSTSRHNDGSAQSKS